MGYFFNVRGCLCDSYLSYFIYVKFSAFCGNDIDSFMGNLFSELKKTSGDTW